jgi:hypothetical protein
MQETHAHLIRSQVAEAALQGSSIVGMDWSQDQFTAVAYAKDFALRAPRGHAFARTARRRTPAVVWAGT